jgi:hypothetical protein
MEGSSWTGQSPQWAVVPMEEEKEDHMVVSRTEFVLRPSASHVQNFGIPTVEKASV